MGSTRAFMTWLNETLSQNGGGGMAWAVLVEGGLNWGEGGGTLDLKMLRIGGGGRGWESLEKGQRSMF